MDGNKKIKGLTASSMVVLSCLLLFSCNDDDFLDNFDNDMRKTSENICFGVTYNGGAPTKAAGSATEYTAGQLVLRSPDTTDTLCVSAIVSDGIINSSALGKSRIATRGTPIDAANFYDSFHVLAYWEKNGELVNEQFYLNEDAVESGNIWSTQDTYFWPGENHALQFYAWAPTSAGGLTAPSTPASRTLSYTVPDEATAQQDIVVASTDNLPGNSNIAVPLTFNHICTAVRFEIGSQIQPGTIKSVSLNGVKYSGNYDMASGNWTLETATSNFSQALDKSVTGTETDGELITPNDGTFMMLPQTLPDGATVTVEFYSSATGSDRILEASIANMEWPVGKTVTYKISITPEFEFKLSDENKVLDAHFEIFKTNLIVSGVPAGQSWTISAPQFNEGNVTIQAQSDMNAYSANQGFWTDRYMTANSDETLSDNGSARGETSYSGSGSGTFPIAIFVPENIGDATRDIELAIQINNQNTAQTIKFSQLSPNWFSSGLGCERIDNGPAPWGFYWTSDYKLIYDLTGCDDNSRENIRSYVEWTKALHILGNSLLFGWIIEILFGDDIPDLSYVDMEKSDSFLGFGGKADNVTINFGELDISGIAESPTDGKANTRAIYNFEGIQYAVTLITQLQSIPGIVITQEGEGLNPTNNAAIISMRLNSWYLIEANDGYILRLVNSPNPDWYLPAVEEINGINDTEYPLQGNYWTSTAVQSSTENSYKFNASGSTSPERRDSELSVRAVRTRP